jgi:hypothetical protein
MTQAGRQPLLRARLVATPVRAWPIAAGLMVPTPDVGATRGYVWNRDQVRTLRL